jgi:hypothetical protein
MAIKQPLVSQSSRAHGAPTDDPIRAGRSRCRSRTGHAGRTTGVRREANETGRPAASAASAPERLEDLHLTETEGSNTTKKALPVKAIRSGSLQNSPSKPTFAGSLNLAP